MALTHRRQELRTATQPYLAGIKLLDRLGAEALQSEQSKLFQREAYIELFPRHLGLCQKLFARTGKSADLVAAFETAERGTARVFLESLGRSRADLLGGVPPEVHAEEARLLGLVNRLDERILQEDQKPLIARNPEWIEDLRKEKERRAGDLKTFLQKLAKDYPRYTALKYPQPCTLQEARSCLAANEVALLYVLGMNESYVLLIEPKEDGPGGGLALYPLPPAQQIAEQIDLLVDRDVLALPRARHLAAAAYDVVLGPAGDRIANKDLVIVPSGALCNLPFELLIEPAPNDSEHYLIEKHRIRYAPSMTVLHVVRQWDQKRPAPKSGLWAVGDPIYEKNDPRVATEEPPSRGSRRDHDTAPKGPARLQFSGQEVIALQKLFGKTHSQVLTGSAATELAVRQASQSGQLAQARYVHFATHGILGLDNNTPPALILNLVGNQKDDGYLQLGEVAELRLNADLVVLSACNTGQGKLRRGEGVTGLARAFLHAGSKGVVCSLWSVDDRETADLMVSFYTHLHKGRPAAEALQQAQREMIEAGKGPRFWAPFILIGE